MEENDDSRPVLIAVISAIDSILDGMRAPLAHGTFTAVAESLFTILRRTEDDSILQEGLECLTFVIRKNVRQLTQWCGTTFSEGPVGVCYDAAHD